MPQQKRQTPESSSPMTQLFPPSELPPTTTRRHVPPGKRRSLGYIPRPPNAFMLFRADFVRQKHIPGSIETNHGSLSKIIGNCWRALPLEEKRVWEIKAKHAKAEHKARYPERPSSVPLPDSRFGAAGITIPTLPFFAGSRPVGKISHSTRYILGQRRASGAQPTIPHHWGVAPPASWQRDESPLPEANTSLFEPSFFDSNFSSQTTQSDCAFSFNEMISIFPPHAPQDFGIAPLDPLHDLSSDINALNFNPNDASAWMSTEYSNSQTSSPYTGSPAHSDMSLPVAAPQPQHAVAQFDHWPDMSQQYTIPVKGLDCLQGSGEQQIMEPQFSGYSTGIEGLFPPLGVVDTHGPHMMGFDYNSYCLS
ncbi:hypothetical protein C8R48DRAFT_767205 [Suillus tomentosus]|nr:hypothetical protein C8R48DRAFT_767205 [Suillus tomentosus]